MSLQLGDIAPDFIADTTAGVDQVRGAVQSQVQRGQRRAHDQDPVMAIATTRVDSDLDAQSPAADLPYEEQHRARVRKYLTLMFWRIPALILAVVAYGIWHNGLISLGILVLSIPLPWMAVLIANDRPPRRAEEPARYGSQRRIPLFPTAERPFLDTERN